MRQRSILLAFLCLLMLALNGAAMGENPPLDVKNVQQVRQACYVGLRDERGAAKLRYLIRMGEQVFPAYEAILSDLKSPPEEVSMVFTVLGYVEADRRRFLKYALAGLTANPDSCVRRNAVLSLEDFGGSATEASPVVALLSDKELETACAAAKTLAAIGGPNEVLATDVWLRGDSHRDNDFIRDRVQKARDQLKKRLDDAKDPKKRSQLRQQCWKNLALASLEEAVVEVHRAVRDLTVGGAETVAFLKERLHPVPAETQKHLDQLLADLDSDSFDRRQAATQELTRGIVAEGVLEKALANRPSLEMRKRLEGILKDFPEWREKNPELLRSIRAIWVLQQIGTPEARALLEKLAAGAPSAALTHKAKDALQSLDRLKKR